MCFEGRLAAARTYRCGPLEGLGVRKQASARPEPSGLMQTLAREAALSSGTLLAWARSRVY